MSRNRWFALSVVVCAVCALLVVPASAQASANPWIDPISGAIGYRMGSCPEQLPSSGATETAIVATALQMTLRATNQGPITCHPMYSFEFSKNVSLSPKTTGGTPSLRYYYFPFAVSGGVVRTSTIRPFQMRQAGESTQFVGKRFTADFAMRLVDSATLTYHLTFLLQLKPKRDKRWQSFGQIIGDPYGPGVFFGPSELRAGSCFATYGLSPTDAQPTALDHGPYLVVPCDSPHNFRVAAKAPLLPPDAPYQGDAATHQLGKNYCPTVPGYTSGFSFVPNDLEWRDGIRSVECVVTDVHS